MVLSGLSDTFWKKGMISSCQKMPCGTGCTVPGGMVGTKFGSKHSTLWSIVGDRQKAGGVRGKAREGRGKGEAGSSGGAAAAGAAWGLLLLCCPHDPRCRGIREIL